ncbi:MAG: hypothetical protein K2H16_00440 [Prevotella sp.]|nr:hypothetical protein [Prevotella sp.]MDE6150807.1 hypothetical protein [Prevotella sp.]
MNDKDFNIKEHFKVPEGYFENLTSQIMANIPEQEPVKVKPSLTAWFRNRSRLPYYAASVAVSLLIVAVVGITQMGEHDGYTYFADTDAGVSVDQYAYTVDEAAYYTMSDNQDIYEMIAE